VTPGLESPPFMIATVLATFLGAVALLLYGLQLVGNGLQAIAGARFRALIASVTRNRLIGAGVGALLTAIIQSSSATTVILVGLTSAGMIQLSQTIPIILGADIGTTLTVQLIAFQIQKLAPFIIASGFFLHFISKKRRFKSIGLALLGFGFIFLALDMMIEAMKPIQSYPWTKDLLKSVEGKPLLAILIAALLTAFFQSSAATLGIALAMGAQELMTLKAALPIILGANIGTCAAAWIASLGAPVEAKRVAVAHVLFKICGVLLIYPFLSPFESWIAETAGSVPRQIANAHTFFNLGLASIFLPLSGPFAKGVTWLVSPPPPEKDPFKPKYLDPKLLDSPSFALEQATREALRIADIAQGMFDDILNVLIKNDQERLDEIKKREAIVDHLYRETKLYITRLSQNALTSDQSTREVAIISLINNLENIGDIIDINLIDLARKKINTGVRFSDAGIKELTEFHRMISQDFALAISAFKAQDIASAEKIVQEKGTVHQRERALRAAHITRLHLGISETIESSAIHLDILTNLKRIKSHITSIAHTLIENSRGENR
jgi:phosphate:Na+ symporter